MTVTSTVRRIVLLFVPPIIANPLRSLWHARRRRAAPVELPVVATPPPPEPAPVAVAAEPPEWEIVADTDATWAALPGWDHGSIAALQAAKWPEFVRSVEGPGMLGRSHEGTAGLPDLATHNTLMTFGYALSRSCGGLATASVLDWGGGVGHYALYSRALLPGVAFDYHVKDLPGLCEAGRSLAPDVTFHDGDETALARRYDFVIASSSIQYVRDPHAMLRRLCEASKEYLLITRTPFLEKHDDMLVVQRPHRYGYMTEYAGWFMNLDRFIQSAAENGFVLDRQFLIGEQPYLPDFEGPVQYYGLLFRRA
jgi:putative methyltransferase (TIGR04325 family)